MRPSKTPVIDQFHNHIKLAVVRSQREYLHDVGVIHRGSNARLLLQLSVLIRLATQLLVQQFERNQRLQLRGARLIHCAHPANTKRFHGYKVIEGSLQQIFLTAVPADTPQQRFITAGIEPGTAYPTRWRHESLPSIDMEIDCNIDELGSKRMTPAR